MATAQPREALARAEERAVFADRENHVLAATGMVAATDAQGAKHGTERDLIQPHGEDQHAAEQEKRPGEYGSHSHGSGFGTGCFALSFTSFFATCFASLGSDSKSLASVKSSTLRGMST